jgi:triacylglycerol lipase
MTEVQPNGSVPITLGSLPLLRAAYSDRAAALMAKLARFAYDFPKGNVFPPPNAPIPEEFAELGFEKITYFNNKLFDGWAYAVESRDGIVIAFRGTTSPQNWETNFQVNMLHPPRTNPKLLVHEGFYRAFLALKDDISKTALQEAFVPTKEPDQDQRPIYITGHSLGGALAQIATAVFASDRIAACYTFGSPRVGNKYFDPWVKPPSYRLVNDADLVPQVPIFAPYIPLPALYRHSGDPRFLPTHCQESPFRYEPGFIVRAWQTTKGLIEFARTKTITGIEDHNIRHYESKLEAIAEARNQSR